MTNAQKEAQKYIKKINQRLAEVANYMNFDSNEVAKYKQALDKAGVSYDFKQTKPHRKALLYSQTQRKTEKK